jgi:hypothetical protein
MNRRLLLLLALPALLSAGCGGGSFTSAVKGAEPATLYEGLPHPMFEEEAFKREQAAGAAREMHGYAFYRDPLPFTADEAKEITRVLADPALYKSFTGEKKCGGFHPDYLVEWRLGGEVYHALFCFTCEEAKLFGPSIESRHDLAGVEAVKRVLAGHHRSRSPAGPPAR